MRLLEDYKMENNKRAVVLVSGGMDSAVVSSIAKEENHELAFLHMNYGQKTHKKELECFNNLADFFKIPSNLRKTVDLSFLSTIGGSSLTDTSIAISNYKERSESIPSSYVPFRNTIILSLAISWAEVIKANKVYIGANYEDSPNYPDCSPEYYKAYNHLIAVGSKEKSISIETPLLFMKKKEIVMEGLKKGTPFELTWSCYAKTDIPCGICDACVLRKRGFREANIEDPI